jgi:hypothetical protein
LRSTAPKYGDAKLIVDGTDTTVQFPRFRSWRPYDTACWDETTSWRLTTGEAGVSTLYVQGVGDLACRRRRPSSWRGCLDAMASR